MLCLNHDLHAPATMNALRELPIAYYGRLLSLARRRWDLFRTAIVKPSRFRRNDSSRCNTSLNNGYHCKGVLHDQAWKSFCTMLVGQMDRVASGVDSVPSGSAAAAKWREAACFVSCHETFTFNMDETRQGILKVLQELPTSWENGAS